MSQWPFWIRIPWEVFVAGDTAKHGSRGGRAGIRKWSARYAPPSQAAILVLDRRIGSLAIRSIALRGCGWSCMAVCSKRGPVAGVGLGRWFSDHSPGWFGA